MMGLHFDAAICYDSVLHDCRKCAEGIYYDRIIPRLFIATIPKSLIKKFYRFAKFLLCLFEVLSRKEYELEHLKLGCFFNGY